MDLTHDQLDALKELINIGVGQAAGMLSEMIDYHIRLQIPEVELLPILDMQNQQKQRLGSDPLSAVKLPFSGSFTGNAQLIFPTESAAMLVSVLTGEDVESPDLDSLKISTLSEVGNILLNGVMGSISNILEQQLDYAIPCYEEEDIDHLLSFKIGYSQAHILLARTQFDIAELQIQGDIVLFFDVSSFQLLLNAIAAVA
ncbi:MAG: chemotaxis protein CheC [Coleofasciculus sp. C1-SOL-03]|uniref:chemotaxis protein CheC n=1 Tax=Coleofasciculus sp. C1-SOL-03 TaxID=3069522 RepID=UPI0032FEE189